MDGSKRQSRLEPSHPLAGKILKAIHAQESKRAAREKAKAAVEELRSIKLKEAAKKVEDSIEEALTYCDFPSEHWTRIRTNNVIERLNREIRRRTRVVASFPDGNSALILVCARLRYVAGTQWGNKKYMNMKHLEAAVEDASIAGCLHSVQSLQTNLRKILDTTRPGHGQSYGAGAVRNAVRAEKNNTAHQAGSRTSLPVRCVFFANVGHDVELAEDTSPKASCTGSHPKRPGKIVCATFLHQ